MNNKDDDLTLYWKSFLSGDDTAFSKLYENVVLDLFSFGTTLTADNELVKDCIQDVFSRLYQNRARLTLVHHIKVYLLIALKNALIDAFKKRKTYQKFIESYDVEEQTEDSQEDRIIAQEDDRAVKILTEKYKSALTKRQQEIIHYRFVDDLSIEEIADLLNINYQSVANSIQKSLKKIRCLYQKREYKN